MGRALRRERVGARGLTEGVSRYGFLETYSRRDGRGELLGEVNLSEEPLPDYQTPTDLLE